MSNIYQDGKYLSDNPDWHLKDSHWKATEIHKTLVKNGVHPLKIVEIGCGAGGILNELLQIYPASQLVGFDASPQAIEFAKGFANGRLAFVLGDFFTSPKQDFDLAICADVFEHIDDYLGFLRSLAQSRVKTVFHIPLDISLVSALMPKIIMKTRKLVGHLHYFNKATAEATLIDCGFKIIDSRVTAGCLEFPDPGLIGKTIWLIRKTVFSINPESAAQLLGGFSLMVLASSE